MQSCAATSQGEAIEASVTAATQSPGEQQIPGPASAGRGAGAEAGSSGSPRALFFPAPLASTRGTEGGDGVSQDLAEWVNGHTHTHTWACLSGWW